MLSSLVTAVSIAAVSIAPQLSDQIARQCDAGCLTACRTLASKTGGQCASPRGLGGCRYDSADWSPRP